MTNQPTREQVMQEPAGQRLDCLVAEHVMGWERSRDYYGDVHFRDPKSGAIIGIAASMHDRSKSSWFNPSRDIAAAWQVFQHCLTWIFSRRSRFLTILGNLCQNAASDAWAEVWPDAIQRLSPELICRAAVLSSQEEPTS